jgi:signal transduction histidine kinase/CheY-like chemotaxis protein
VSGSGLASHHETIVGLSRELALVCLPDGRVLAVDEAARRLLGEIEGCSLVDLAPDGTDDRVRALLKDAQRGRVESREVCLLVGGRPCTLDFRGCPADGQLVFVGSLLADDVAQMLGRISQTAAELAVMHRQSERQQWELRSQNDELRRLNGELDESNRGMRALHAEIADTSDSLRRVSEVKSRVISNVSHEFRTPVHSILGLTEILLSRADGELTEEQERQIGFIRRSAQSLGELVNDLLDISKLEAGRAVFRPSRFSAAELFAALRGILRPLHSNEAVALRFEEPPADLELETDEGKLSQVLRNLVGNALKFTERGEVVVSVRMDADGLARFDVRDTGIGIARTDHERVFEEFAQIEHPLQLKVKGTGLGLSLSRRLAGLLGGTLTLDSAPGVGSTFTLRIPAVHPEVREMQALAARAEVLEPGRAPILVLEDDRQTLFLYERYLRDAGFQIVPARSVDDARLALARVRPAAIVLDVMLDGETSWSFLGELKSNPATSDIPVLVVTVTNRHERARALGADEFCVKPIDREWLTRKLAALARQGHAVERVLVVDDDELSRYMVRKMLAQEPYEVIEASDGREGLRAARERAPHVIILDFMMPGLTAFDVLDELKADPVTRHTPVIIHTSKQLTSDERSRLATQAADILPKQSVSRELAIGRIRDVLAKAGAESFERQERGGV